MFSSLSLSMDCSLVDVMCFSFFLQKTPSARVDPRSVKGRRTQAEIAESGAYERETFSPGARGTDRAALKSQLQDVMSFGKETAEAKKRVLANKAPRAPAAAAKKKQKEQKGDEFDAVVAEIEDRKAYLEKMGSKLPRDEVTRLRTEISQRVRQLEDIDRRRNEELKRLEAAHGASA
eukprot:m.33243 g.33243  ORF g.33243 m.33243 type:complete len:177 (+) comp5602_c0_seq1:253-783(+)